MKTMVEQGFGYASLPDDIQRSTFRKPYRYKGTFNADELIPFFRQDVYPGDEMSVRSNMYARLITPMFPIMDDIILETWYFEVSLRLIWENFKQFFGEVLDPISNPTTPSDFTMPSIDTSAAGFAEGSIWDHLGLPIGVQNIFTNATWSRAYNFIVNEWFRDQDLEDRVTVDVDDGPDDMADYPIYIVNKHHDYFTSARPWPQKFDEVTVPLGDTAPVVGDGKTLGWDFSPSAHFGTYQSSISGALTMDSGLYGDPVGAAAPHSGFPPSDYALGVTTDPNNSGLIADLASATAASINQLREAFALQRMQELMARTGSRYTEQIFALFRVKSPDARQQRPVYLGGGRQYINIHEHRLNTAANVDANGTCDTMSLTAFLDTFHESGFRAAFTEHGVVLGLCAVRGALTYQQGVPRWMRYRTRDDFYAPPLAHLGEQPVYNAELYAQGTADDELVYGYQERWSERRCNHSVVAGKFKSAAVQSLDAWHLAQNFGSLPPLESTFIKSNLHGILTRVTAVTNQPDVMMDCYHDITYTTQMPVYSVPGFIDHH